jgi:hypothetical protein
VALNIFGIKLADTDLDDAIAKVIDHGGKLLRRTGQPVGSDRAYMGDPDGYVSKSIRSTSGCFDLGFVLNALLHWAFA